MKKIITTTLLGVMALFVVQGCYKVATVQVDNSPAVTKTVSFIKDIVPVFTKHCALAGCHGSGGHAPDLSADNAYNSLINGKFIDTKSPDKSLLYLLLTGKESVAMPMGAANNPSNINGLTLAWITQGAKNN